MVKVADMFRFAIWILYYKLRNNLLPPYFNYMKPNLPVICNHYNVRNAKFHLPLIKHEFAKQLLQYCLIKLLNEEEYHRRVFSPIRERADNLSLMKKTLFLHSFYEITKL